MKSVIFKNWHFIRVLRLIIGISILVQAIMGKDLIFGIAGVFFTLMPIFNVGCCGSGTCYTPIKKSNDISKSVVYEELD